MTSDIYNSAVGRSLNIFRFSHPEPHDILCSVTIARHHYRSGGVTLRHINAAVRNRLYYLARLLQMDAGLYMAEGVLLNLATGLVSNNYYLFASAMGANDYQLSLIQFAPQMVNMIILLPAGIFLDSLANKKKMVVMSILVTSIVYIGIMCTPFMGGARLFGFIALLSVAAGMFTLYNISWQSFFPEVVEPGRRNGVLTLRTTWTFAAGVIGPLITGFVLSGLADTGQKIKAHQIFYVVAAALLLSQSFVLRKLKSKNPAPPIGVSFANLKKAGTALIHNKKFLFFCGTIFVLYMAWQMDWTLYFIGQTRYLKMNESWLSYAVIGNALCQFFMVRFWSRKNEKFGVAFPLIFAAAGMVLYEPLMVFSSSLPSPINRYIFLPGYSLIGLTQTTMALNVFQNLLRVLPDEHKTISISIFSVITSLSNAVMPLLGVTAYNHLGADLRALHLTCWIVGVFRLAAAGLWAARWYATEKRGKAAGAGT